VVVVEVEAPLISHNQIKAGRIATARTPDASNSTVNVFQVESIAKTAIATGVATTSRMNR